MEIQLKKVSESAPAPVKKQHTHKFEVAKITNPDLLAERERLEAMDGTGKMTVHDKLRLHRLQKFGDNIINKIHCKPAPKPQEIKALLSDDASVNNGDETPTQQDIKPQIIEDYLHTLDIITTLNNLKVSKLKYIEYLQDSNFTEKLKKAREAVADSYIHKILLLNDELKNGNIDPCTHANLCNIYKWLSANLNILYNDKITEKTPSNSVTNNTLIIDSDKVKSLNNLLNGGANS